MTRLLLLLLLLAKPRFFLNVADLPLMEYVATGLQDTDAVIHHKLLQANGAGHHINRVVGQLLTRQFPDLFCIATQPQHSHTAKMILVLAAAPCTAEQHEDPMIATRAGILHSPLRKLL